MLTVGDGESTEAMLRCKLRYERYTDAHTSLLAVRDVYLGGPAHQAGLQPYKDFIVGTRELTSFASLATFGKFVQVNVGQQVSLAVYSTDTGEVREVQVMPSNTWGSPEQGVLGCDVRQGLANVVPQREVDKERSAHKAKSHSLLDKLAGGAQAESSPAR